MKTMGKSLIVLFSFISLFSFSQKTEYFRQLRYNHVSPFIDIIGIHPIDEATAKSTSHYIFKTNKYKEFTEIINNHYHTEKVHPLYSLGAHRVVFEYVENKEIRTFYDINNKRVKNDRGVFKEIYLTNVKTHKVQLNFYDLENNPMESNWKIAEYRWKKAKKITIEKRYNLKKELVNVSPYFDFGITGIVTDKNGAPKGHYNLNEKLEITENRFGIASYQDTYDVDGNHVKYSYHNKNDELIINQWNFSIGEKSYDAEGNNIELTLRDSINEVMNTRKVYSNTTLKIAAPASESDSLEIRKVALGYLMALQELKPNLMDSILNDSLNKITIGYDRNTRKQIGRATTKNQMIEFATSWNKTGTQFPLNPTYEIEILDIYDHIATVKLVSDNWVEYLQLLYLNDRWEIMNLIWQFKDVKRYGQ